MGSFFKIFKITDIFIIFIAAGFTVFSAYAAYMKPQTLSQVLIKGQGREWTFPVNAQETIAVPGPLGDTVIRIQNGGAWVESSPCKNQTCIGTGLISHQGQWAACLPNNVLLIIHGAEEENVDAAVW
jgi:hypothetical protein